jgi:acyl-CoA reductase-like NAD-dependent aldehyde dehydrogenase
MTTATEVREFWVAGKPRSSGRTAAVVSPYDGTTVATVAVPEPADVEEAVAAAAEVAHELAAAPAYVRAEALAHVSRRLAERKDEITALIRAENGKPTVWAAAEAARAVSVFRLASEEARRFSGTVQRLDTDPGGAGRLAYTTRVPRGPVLGIAPFNFPLNLVAHKVAPALAVGAPIIIKPAPATPLSSLLLGELLAETDLPAGSWSVLTVANEAMPALVADPRLPVISFTGSDIVGFQIRDAVPRKHVVLELGGNAAVVVAPDWAGEADLRLAAGRVATFAMYQAGQSCISVQRVYVCAPNGAAFTEAVVEAVAALRTGAPDAEGVQVGPVTNEKAAERIEGWIGEAVAAGATVRIGGTREGTTVAPTVLTGVPRSARVSADEVFGPVVLIEEVPSLDAAFAAVNDSRFGLQAGVFTHDIGVAFRAHRELAVGGVIVGDVPSYRADQMPYGGVKDSGSGREGVASAMADLTEERVLVLTGLQL